MAARDRHAELREDGLGLMFVDIHAAFREGIGGDSPWRRVRRVLDAPPGDDNRAGGLS
jgi:hypothetical protein